MRPNKTLWAARRQPHRSQSPTFRLSAGHKSRPTFQYVAPFVNVLVIHVGGRLRAYALTGIIGFSPRAKSISDTGIGTALESDNDFRAERMRVTWPVRRTTAYINTPWRSSPA